MCAFFYESPAEYVAAYIDESENYVFAPTHTTKMDGIVRIVGVKI